MHDYLEEFKTRLLTGAEDARGGRRSHRKLLAIAPALVPVAMIAGVVIASATGRGVGPVPTGFRPESFTAISDAQWWLLGTAPCRSPPCTSIVRTLDGGRVFKGLPAPQTSRVSQLRFADLANGYAFGPQLWSTHDGGETWKRVDVAGSVTDLAAADGWVFAVLSTSNGRGELLRSSSGRDAWGVVGGLVGIPFSGLWTHGPTVLVETQSLSGSVVHLSISSDSGAHFRLAGPPPPSITCRFEGAPPVIWAPCATGMMSGVWRSTDDGGTFTGVGGDATRSGIPAAPNSAAFAAASPTTAVYGYQQLWRTSDAGSHWSRVPGTSGATWWTYLGFTDATHGVAIGQFPAGNRVYYTTDGGRSYRYVPIRS